MTKKDTKNLVKKLQEQGWDCEQTRNGHWRYRSPNGKDTVIDSKSPSDPRSAMNTRALLRKAGADI